jgi:hypothetical protein
MFVGGPALVLTAAALGVRFLLRRWRAKPKEA